MTLEQLDHADYLTTVELQNWLFYHKDMRDQSKREITKQLKEYEYQLTMIAGIEAVLRARKKLEEMNKNG